MIHKEINRKLTNDTYQGVRMLSVMVHGDDDHCHVKNVKAEEAETMAVLEKHP